MFEVGRICVKTAGRDAKGYCVVVDVLDNNYVLVDGGVRRRKVNSLHLIPTAKTADIKKGASSEEVKKAFEKLGLKVYETKPKQAKEKPKKAPKKKVYAEPKKEKKPVKKEAPKKAESKPAPKKDEGKATEVKPVAKPAPTPAPAQKS